MRKDGTAFVQASGCWPAFAHVVLWAHLAGTVAVALLAEGEYVIKCRFSCERARKQL